MDSFQGSFGTLIDKKYIFVCFVRLNAKYVNDMPKIALDLIFF